MISVCHGCSVQGEACKQHLNNKFGKTSHLVQSATENIICVIVNLYHVHTSCFIWPGYFADVVHGKLLVAMLSEALT